MLIRHSESLQYSDMFQPITMSPVDEDLLDTCIKQYCEYVAADKMDPFCQSGVKYGCYRENKHQSNHLI